MLYTNEEIQKRKNREKSIRKKISIFLYILLIPILIYNLVLIAQSIITPNKTPNFLGIKTYAITSGSMEPNINIGDIVIVEEVDETDLKVGDVISYRKGQTIITHRIAKIENSEGHNIYITKGDNNNTEDMENIEIDRIEGKVVLNISKIGYLAIFLKDKIVLISIVLCYILYIIHNNKIQKRKLLRREKRMAYDKKIKEGNEIKDR